MGVSVSLVLYVKLFWCATEAAIQRILKPACEQVELLKDLVQIQSAYTHHNRHSQSSIV